MTQQNTAEKRTFGLHPAIIYQVIHAQTGSLSKAIGEAIQNSIDAGASRIDVTLDTRKFCVSDDGRGFSSRQEIEQYFEVFGTPHQEGDARFGKFRIGRGQLLSYASTLWQSGYFMMDVDIRNRGLDYHLTEHATSVYPGCRIEGTLYEPILPSELDAIVREFRQLVAYVDIPVTLNGESISTSPSSMTWDHETEDAYIKLKTTGSLKIYNMGVFVTEVPQFRHGTGGLIVSKRAFEVNFARNSVLENRCPIWKRVVPFVRSQAQDRNTKAPRLNDEARLSLANQYKHGELQYDRFRDLKLIRDVHGRYHPVCKLAELHKLPLALAPADKDDIGKALHDRKLAFVLSPKTMEWFEVDSVRGLLDVLASRTGAQWLSQGYLNADIRDFESLKSCVGGEYFVLKDDEVDTADLHALDAIRKASYQFPNLVGRANSSRKIFAGKSETSLAWTDGATYIAIEQGMLRNCRQGLAGFLAVVMALADRYLYSRSSLDGEPDADHLEEFHNLVSGPAAAALSTIAVDTFHAYVRTLRDKGIRIPRDIAVDEDMDATFDWLTTESGNIKPN